MSAVKFDLTKVRKALSSIPEQFDGKDIQVGWFESSRYPDGTQVAYVATIQEMGAPERGIPPRPFMSPTVQEQSKEWANILAGGIRAVSSGKYNADDVLTGLGEAIKGDIYKAISEVNAPALSPVTLLLRKWRKEGRVITGKTVGQAAAAIKNGESPSGVDAKPLVDSDYMRTTIDAQIGNSNAD